jgi:preprotein translocase subunit SecA
MKPKETISADFEKNITYLLLMKLGKNTYVKWTSWNNQFNLAVHEQRSITNLQIWSFQLQRYVNGINKEVISFLFKGDLPQQTAQKFKKQS